jgi:GTP cyclohydrolase I
MKDKLLVASAERNVRELLKFIGEDPDRPGLKETPYRVIKMYQEFFCGYDSKRLPRIMTVNNGEDGVVYNEMLIDQGYFFSFCEHHCIPFFGQYFYGYIPDQKVMGASKIGRTIDYYAGRLQIAERLVNQVVNRIGDVVRPKGQVLVMNARHLCKEMRGLKKWDSPYEAIAVRGAFAKNLNGCKEEFMLRIQRR